MFINQLSWQHKSKVLLKLQSEFQVIQFSVCNFMKTLKSSQTNQITTIYISKGKNQKWSVTTSHNQEDDGSCDWQIYLSLKISKLLLLQLSSCFWRRRRWAAACVDPRCSADGAKRRDKADVHTRTGEEDVNRGRPPEVPPKGVQDGNIAGSKSRY